MRKPCIWEIPIETFLETVRQNIRNYNNLAQFWLPIIEARAKKHFHSAEDCLLNPLFRWCYQNKSNRLEGFERELEKLKKILPNDFKGFHKYISEAIVTKPSENEAHNRMWDARAEIRGMLYYAKSGYSITLEPRQRGIRTHDFNACSGSSNIAVEAKFLRYPDILHEYLMRWWDTARAVSGTRPLGIAPYIKFRWKLIDYDLTLHQIEELKKLFRSVFLEPNLNRSLSTGRIQIEYSPDNSLTESDDNETTWNNRTEHPVDLLIKKLEGNIEKAEDQLKGAGERGMQTACYLLVNITADIPVRFKKEYVKAKNDLRKKYRQHGLEIVIEEVGYL